MRLNVVLALAIVGLAFVGIADTAAASHTCNTIPPGNARDICIDSYNAVCGVARIVVDNCPIS